MFRNRFGIAFILVMMTAFMPASSAAQSSRDSGEYVILNAQYGTARRNVDVTERLKELARRDRTIRITNNTFGIDPDPNQKKTLRIYARNSNGEEEMFEYREGNTVDGSQFRGWNRGNWGSGGWSGGWEGNRNRDDGEYTILGAQYGTSRRNVDVTERLKELARRDRAIRITNNTFGVDPDPNKKKTLRIFARNPNGDEEMFEYREGNTVDGSQFRGWSRGNWGMGGWSGRWEGGRDRDRDSGDYVILRAQYGTSRRNVDVTDQLKNLARRDGAIMITNSTFGVDPDPNKKKTLRIYARNPNGEEEIFEYREGNTVDGSRFRGWSRGNWGNGGRSGGWEGNRNGTEGDYAILRAQYGTSRRNIDVTERLRTLARGNRSVRVDNATFGADPDPNQAKTLQIFVRTPEGDERMVEYREGSTIDGSQFRGWSRGDWGDGGGRWNPGER